MWKYLVDISKSTTFALAIKKLRLHNRIDSLAQQVEHNTFNVGVLGSSPKRITQIIRELLKSDSLFLCLN